MLLLKLEASVLMSATTQGVEEARSVLACGAAWLLWIGTSRPMGQL